MKIIFAGAGEFGAPTLKALLDAGHEVIRVITQPDRPAGRGRTLTPTPIGLLAEQLNLPAIKTSDINSLELPPADLLIVIAFGQKISEAVTHHARLGSINLHASLLPRHRGAAPINAAILSGDTITGNSVIRLAQKMDAGALLGQSSVTIGDIETAGELHDRLSVDGAPLVLRVVEELAAGTSNAIEQDAALATLAKKMSRETARVDWTQPAEKISQQIRGLWPWPGCRVAIMDGETPLDTLGLVRARSVKLDHANAEPGIILKANGKLVIAAGIGSAVELLEVQPAGKRAMPIDAYSRGKRFETGLSLRNV